ncbi:MAG: NAD(P)-dependent oxidoreductase [Marinovum algicola]|jgi:nucleoside-diphosphate-sugar epimerase|uniref:UDP-glucose 4-epimerase n=1 Tax=Marinovum algicola TaxID=42444 RepID=A0A975WCK1_9RHOB|nr:NAD(P)-dependent oxidoreductase [Marinovum algicola]AKO99719.1 Nucleoside-diphosphate-sugar epimerase [Marinovum algicola DG 898]SEJ92412.1 UDP-glucose 4-epimerase [Marinovum algicola]SLN65322.1 dTDP-6-deoxy-L-talose 4-dehydrogenase (NAD(+)) [Marinovum algicola]
MKIAVTGGQGGFGRVVVREARAAGHAVISIDRTAAVAEPVDGVEYRAADAADYAQVTAALTGADAVIHLAAFPAAGLAPDDVTHNNNVTASYNVLLASAELGLRRICNASSVNAIGHSYSRAPEYDYFPIDEDHPTRAEDPYSLSKWLGEMQADAIVRRYDGMKIASLRLHWIVEDVARAAQAWQQEPDPGKHLWAWTPAVPAARAALRSLEADFDGHQRMFLVSHATTEATPSRDLARRHFPGVRLKAGFDGTASFFDSSRARRLLGWSA